MIATGGVEARAPTSPRHRSSDFLIIDLSDSKDPLGAIKGLADLCEPGTRVIALGTANDVRLYRA